MHNSQNFRTKLEFNSIAFDRGLKLPLNCVDRFLIRDFTKKSILKLVFVSLLKNAADNKTLQQNAIIKREASSIKNKISPAREDTTKNLTMTSYR
jgi:hypothetical protein